MVNNKSKTCSVCDTAGVHCKGMCRKCYNKQYREVNKEYLTAYDKERAHTPERVAQNKKSQERNHDKYLSQRRQHYDDDKETILTRNKLWRDDNKDWVTNYNGDYYKGNKETLDAQHMEYHEKNRETLLPKMKAYNMERRSNMTPEELETENAKRRVENMTPEQREYERVRSEERRANRTPEQIIADKEYTKQWHRDNPAEPRDYVLSPTDPSCATLNKWFDGCEGHHLEWNVVMYVPKELNRSIYHNIKTGQGMEEINARAMEWLESGVVPGYDMTQSSLGVFL